MTRFPKLAAAIAALTALAAAARAQDPGRAQDATFDSNGTKIHYIFRGEGEPVLLIHGYTASARMNWSMPGIVALLAKNHMVIALDNRGHGQSDKPEDPKQYGVQMVEDSIRLLDHLGVKRAHVVGYSMGGMITLKLLTLHPERVISATIGGMGWYRTRMQGDASIEDEPVEGMNKAWVACRRSWVELETTEAEVKAIKVPMQVLIGEDDPIRRRWVEPMRQIRPDVPVVVVPRAVHVNCIVKPEFKSAIVDFIAKNSGAGAKKP